MYIFRKTDASALFAHGEIYILPSRRERRDAHIESSPVLDTSCLAVLIYDLRYRQFLCLKSPNPVKIQYLLPMVVSSGPA